MKRAIPFAFVIVATLLMAGCGFHLRTSANLPAGMQRVHLTLSGPRPFQRALRRAIVAGGSTVMEASGPGIAELKVSQARFSRHELTISGEGRITEYAVRFHVTFDVRDAQGGIIVPQQNVVMTRTFEYDPSEAVGRDSRVEVLEDSMTRAMVRSIMFRLEAAGDKAVASDSGQS